MLQNFCGGPYAVCDRRLHVEEQKRIKEELARLNFGERMPNIQCRTLPESLRKRKRKITAEAALGKSAARPGDP